MGIEFYFRDCLSFLSSLSWQEAGILFWHFFCLEFPRYIFTGILVVFQTFIKSRPDFQTDIFRRQILHEPPLVSVIIPAHNEAETILDAITSLINQSYPNLELIVIDDGSTDGTDRICQPLAKAGRIKLLRNELRGGKSSAANLGLYHSRGEYILAIDADTVFDKEAISNIMLGFADPQVGAVSGNIRISNARQNLLTRLQAMHYLLTISLGRLASSWLDALYIVSGAFGIYRRELLESTGGWDAGPGEDLDLTIKGRKWGAKIAFIPQAVCWTKVPSSVSSFIKQQLRWERSLVFYHFRKHNSFKDLFNPGFRLGNFLGAVDVFVYQFIMTYSFFIYLGWLFVYYRELFIFILISSYLLYLAANCGLFLLVWILSDYKNQDLRLIIYLPLYCIFNGYFLRFIRFRAFSEEFLLRKSYSDPHVPDKVLERMVKW